MLSKLGIEKTFKFHNGYHKNVKKIINFSLKY